MEIFVALTLVLFAVMAFFVVKYTPADHSQYDEPQGPLVITADEVSAEHDQVLAKLREFHRNASRQTAKAREGLERLFYRDVDAEITNVDAGGVPAEWVLAEGANPKRRLLFLHGGAFRVGSPKSHRHLTYELSKRCGLAVLAIDYRMNPEFKVCDAVADARTAYAWILENGPGGQNELEALFVAGDSAGGNLTLSTIAWARDRRLRPADGAIAFAPGTDSTLSSPTWKANIATDPFLGPGIGPLLKIPGALLRLGARLPFGCPPTDPRVSPLLGNLSNLPKTLIQVSRDEMLYGDSQRYANKATAQGSPVTLQIWPKMVHVFQAFPELPETDIALTKVAEFVGSTQTA